MSPEIINAKVSRRYLKGIWRKSAFYRNMISDNPRQLWNYINRTLYWKASVSLPVHDSTNSLCNSFSKTFKENITQIHASFPSSASSCNIHFQAVHQPCTVFKLTEVSKLILSSLNNSCELDPIPTFLLISYIYTLIVPITKIINLIITKLRSVPFSF